LEILTGAPGFPESLTAIQIIFMVDVKDKWPEIPDSVFPEPRTLVENCWATNPDDRTTFEEIVDRLAEMEFKLTTDVNCGKVVLFVRMIESWG
jgi:hypothetical protein